MSSTPAPVAPKSNILTIVLWCVGLLICFTIALPVMAVFCLALVASIGRNVDTETRLENGQWNTVSETMESNEKSPNIADEDA